MRPTVTIVCGLLMLSALSTNAQINQPRDWPCIQQFVEEVVPAIVWPGPLASQYGEDWRDLPHVADFAGQLTGASSPDSQDLISQFAANEPPAAKTKNLTLLFFGVWEMLNDRRRNYMQKIIKYSEHQRAISDQLEDLLIQLESFAADPESIKLIEDYQELESRVHWHMRVFDQRERTILHLCEQPVLIETRLGEIARMIYNELD